MERIMQERPEVVPAANSRLNLNLQNLNHGYNSYGRRKPDNRGNRSPTTGESTEVEDHQAEEPEDREDDGSQDEIEPSGNRNTRYPVTRAPMVCGMCRLAPGVAGVAGVSTSPGPMLTCTQGHLLCQQCVHRYTVCSDIGCVVCGAELYASTSSCYRVAHYANSRHLHLQSSSGDPRAVQAIRSNNKTTKRSLSTVKEVDRSKIWTGNYNYEASGVRVGNGLPFFGSNSRCDMEYNLDWDGEAGDAIHMARANVANSARLQPQVKSYCSIRGGDADLEVESGRRIDSGVAGTTGNVALLHAECSRRPIRCPRLDCARNVAFSALTQHFLFDHPEVPILSVEPGVKSTLVVSFAALSCESSRCLALLLVSDKLTGAAARLFNGSQIQPRYRNRLPLPVLAARIHCSNQNPCTDKGHAHGEGQVQGDVVIAWVAGLDIGGATTGALRCSIQAVDGNDNGGLRSLTYTGPVNSLRTAQCPRDVFTTGDCVILHQGLIDHITSGYTSLSVNVIVH